MPSSGLILSRSRGVTGSCKFQLTLRVYFGHLKVLSNLDSSYGRMTSLTPFENSISLRSNNQVFILMNLGIFM